MGGWRGEWGMNGVWKGDGWALEPNVGGSGGNRCVAEARWRTQF